MEQRAEQNAIEPLPTTPEDLFKILAELNIDYQLHRHEPIFTVAEGEHLKKNIPGEHCRNLFIRDKKERMFLVVAANDTAIELKKLQGLLQCGRLSFGSPERLWRTLGIRPGSVCPFCIVNDREKHVEILLDKTMMEADLVCYHPLDNAMTIGLSPADLLRFIEFTEHRPHIIDLDPAKPEET